MIIHNSIFYQHRQLPPDSEPDECDEGEAKCANGQCIRESYVCDGGAPDCDDGSDETNCLG